MPETNGSTPAAIKPAYAPKYHGAGKQAPARPGRMARPTAQATAIMVETPPAVARTRPEPAPQRPSARLPPRPDADEAIQLGGEAPRHDLRPPRHFDPRPGLLDFLAEHADRAAMFVEIAGRYAAVGEAEEATRALLRFHAVARSLCDLIDPLKDAIAKHGSFVDR